MKKKKLIIILVMLFSVMLVLYFGYKCLLLFVYNKSYEFTDKYFGGSLDNFNVVNTITINKKNVLESDYLKIPLKELGYKKNLKIRNDFDDFEKVINNLYYQRDDNNKIIKFIEIKESYQFVFAISSYYQYIYDYDKDKSLLSFVKEFVVGNIEDVDLFNFIRIKLMSADVKKLLEENDINNDFDLYQYAKNIDDSISIFSSIKKIKEVYTLKEILGDVITGQVVDANNITLINGDYSGFICNHDDVRNVYIFYNEYVYEITVGKPNYFPDKYIKNLISTLVIEE